MSSEAGRPASRPIDYGKVAHRYDRHRGHGGPYSPVLRQVARHVAAQRVVEVGCGTGNATLAFLPEYPCAWVGVEPSRAMIEQARRKLPDRPILRAVGEALPLATDGCDFYFAVFVMQHFTDRAAAYREAFRVLRSGGSAAFVTASHQFIRHHPMNHYFPSFAAIDTARFPDVPEVMEGLHAAGFDGVTTTTASRPAEPIDEAYADKIEARFISTYELVPPAEFERGLQQLRSDLAAGRGVPEAVAWECVVVVAEKA
jgi:SAM-dependent methyltransferase